MKSLIFCFTIVFIYSYLVEGQNFVNSSHDFSGAEWNIQSNTCNVCHLEIESGQNSLKPPLWNHNYKNVEYKVYQSKTLDATVGQPEGVTKLCLSCHDGTIALNNFGGSLEFSKYVPKEFMLGTDLRDDHPVSFKYDHSLAETDGGLYNPSETESGLGSTIAEDLLIDNQLHCTSCHDVHNIMGNDKLLVITNQKSTLCLTCHKK